MCPRFRWGGEYAGSSGLVGVTEGGRPGRSRLRGFWVPEGQNLLEKLLFGDGSEEPGCLVEIELAEAPCFLPGRDEGLGEVVEIDGRTVA
jgi:hypothetical protein